MPTPSIYSQPSSNLQSPPSNQTSTSSSISYTKTSYHNASNIILRTPTAQPNSAPSASQQQSNASLQATLPAPSVTSSHPTSSHTTMQ
jgi:hypothetical protein